MNDLFSGDKLFHCHVLLIYIYTIISILKVNDRRCNWDLHSLNFTSIWRWLNIWSVVDYPFRDSYWKSPMICTFGIRQSFQKKGWDDYVCMWDFPIEIIVIGHKISHMKNKFSRRCFEQNHKREHNENLGISYLWFVEQWYRRDVWKNLTWFAITTT